MLKKLAKNIARQTPLFGRIMRERDSLAVDALSAQRQLEVANGKVSELESCLHMLGPVTVGARAMYSHWGEDSIIEWLFKQKNTGFYVDFGAFHPSAYSNTKRLFDRGWRGLNVECNAKMIELFNELRPNDINLNVAVADSVRPVDFYFFGEWATSNTTSAHFAQAVSSGSQVPVKRMVKLEGYTTAALLDKFLPAGQQIDFFNIDVESLDLVALETNNWEKYRPLVLAVEDFDFRFDDNGSSPIGKFMRKNGYHQVARNIYTSFFVDSTRVNELNGVPP